MTSTPIPSSSSFSLNGSQYWVFEYTITDGCNSQRMLPSCIIAQPVRTCYTPGECTTYKYAFTQWSTTAMFYDTSGSFQSCLNHQFSIKLSIRNDSDITTIIDNIVAVLERFKLDGSFGSISTNAALNNLCQP